MADITGTAITTTADTVTMADTTTTTDTGIITADATGHSRDATDITVMQMTIDDTETEATEATAGTAAITEHTARPAAAIETIATTETETMHTHAAAHITAERQADQGQAVTADIKRG